MLYSSPLDQLDKLFVALLGVLPRGPSDDVPGHGHGQVDPLALHLHGCQIAKFDPFLSLDCARVEGMGAQGGGRGGAIQGKEGIKFCCVA